MAYFPFQPGQQPMSSSQGVVIASDQSPVSITGTVLVGGVPNVNTTGSVVAFQGGAWTPSVSGTVGASIIGLPPVNVVGTPSISGAITVIGNPSISGTVGASVVGLPPVRVSDGTETLDIYQENQQDASAVGIAIMFKSDVSSSIMSVPSPSTPLPTIGSVSGSVGIVGNPSISGTVNVGNAPSIYGNISGSVIAVQSGTRVTSIASITPSSVLVGASIFGQLPAGSQVIGSVATLQGTNPWIVNFANSSILAAQQGTQISSIVNSIPSSVLVGNYGHRNDSTSSFLGGNLTWNPLATDSAGRVLIKPFSSDDGTLIEYVGSVVSTSVTAIRASAIGLRNYVTDFFIANTGSVATLITFQDGSTSILARTIAPATGGSNAPGISIPFKSARSQDLAFTVGTSVSVLHMTVRGYQAP